VQALFRDRFIGAVRSGQRDDTYLRTLLIVGARAVIEKAQKSDVPASPNDRGAIS